MRRRFSPEYKEQAVARLWHRGGTKASVAAELDVTLTQPKTWRLEPEAAGSASAIERRRADTPVRFDAGCDGLGKQTQLPRVAARANIPCENNALVSIASKKPLNRP
jgi:transposase-like protein